MGALGTISKAYQHALPFAVGRAKSLVIECGAGYTETPVTSPSKPRIARARSCQQLRNTFVIAPLTSNNTAFAFRLDDDDAFSDCNSNVKQNLGVVEIASEPSSIC